MKLNSLTPAEGSIKNNFRRGRGQGSGGGGTATQGHKGAQSRSGNKKKRGFEGGQMPLQRRLPKRGFKSMTKANTAHVRTSELLEIESGIIDLLALKAAKIISGSVSGAKIFLSGDVTRKIAVEGLLLTKGARLAIEAAGGTIVDLVVVVPVKKLVAKAK